MSVTVDGLVNVVRRDLENHLPHVAGAIAVVFDDEHTMRRKCRRMANPCPERSVKPRETPPTIYSPPRGCHSSPGQDEAAPGASAT
jgi:hypothetical protein